MQAALLSPETGIVDAHELISAMETEFEGSEDGAAIYGTKVVRIDRSSDDGKGAKGKRGDANTSGWVVQTENESKERSAILARCIVNSAGLRSVHPAKGVIGAFTKRLY